MNISPFPHQGETISPSSVIDRKLSSLFDFIQYVSPVSLSLSFSNFSHSQPPSEFDSHFQHHHHRFQGDFIPRFSLEEDANAYFLIGELPGATKDDISIEMGHDRLSLTIKGCIGKPNPIDIQQRENGNGLKKNANGSQVEIMAGGKGYIDEDLHNGSREAVNEEKIQNGGKLGNWERTRNQRTVLLNERLTGEFHRKFNFSWFVVEDAIQASVENGLLYVVVPKKEILEGKRIPVKNGGLTD
jgi:HSP20 family molecular chaperone IbpA